MTIAGSNTGQGKIAVTPRSLSRDGHPALNALREAGYEVIFPTPGRQPAPDELRSFLPDCVGYLAGVEPVPGDILQLCKELKVISRNGVGVDNVDLDAAGKLGIAVEKAAGANARGVAELAIALMLSGLRSVPWSDQQLKGGNWSRRKGLEVCGRTLGIVGCGQIGKYVAEMAVGLGMRVLAYDPFPDLSFAPRGDFGYVGMDELLQQADVVSLHCPPSAQPLIDAVAVAQMRPGAFLINTARAALIDEEAVLAALESGRLSGLATDVYVTEPPGLTPLVSHERVIATPHAGGFTEESVTRATEMAVANLLKILNRAARDG